MKKTTIIFLLTIFILIGAIGTYIFINKNKLLLKQNKIEKTQEENKKYIKNKQIIKEEKQEKKEENKKKSLKTKRISEFKKMLKARGLIIKGDINLKNKEYLIALQHFVEANRNTPNNPKILEKIGEIYFHLKKFNNAFKYLNSISDRKEVNKDLLVKSFLYKQNLEEKDFIFHSGSLNNKQVQEINKIKGEINKLNIDKEEKFYYKNSLECIKNFNDCKINFEAYFKDPDYSGINSFLENIRKAIESYKNLKLEEEYFKNTLIIGGFLKNETYPVAIILGRELLKEKTNYKPVLKIIAQSYYELGKIDKAKKYLLKYTRIDTTDADVSYMLGAINQKQHNYIQSNIFLDLALKQKYFDKESIYRLKLYNYLILEQTEKINSTFDRIIALQDKPSFNDLVLATYYNIINKNLTKALVYSNKGIKLYSKREDFYGLKAWILIEQKDFEQAKSLLEKAEKINPRNAVIALNLGRLELENYMDTSKKIKLLRAKKFFERARGLDNTDIGKIADLFLNKIKNLEEETKKQKD